MDSRRGFLKGGAIFGASAYFHPPLSAPVPTAERTYVLPVLSPPPSLPVAGSTSHFPVRRIYCVGRNYLAHVREMGHDEREPPFFFAKANDMIVQNGVTIPYPTLTRNYHHEVELVVAMKSGGMGVPVEAALDHVYGYAVGLDMTRRDLQQAAAMKGHPWEAGKSFDHAAPSGTIYPATKAGHIHKGKIQLEVNGAIRQDADISMMIWNVAEVIHHLSLEVGIAAGDLIYTGTPDGVGPVVSGDRMVGRIEQLGEIAINIA